MWPVLAIMLGLAIGPGQGIAVLAQERSPALGHAQVIAQGVAPMPNVPVAWRVVSMSARPADEASVAERSLGFVVPVERPVLITDEATGQQVRLAVREASFVPQSARQQRASTSFDTARYIALELVVAPDLAAGYSLGDAVLLYGSEPFLAPSGRRDLDLVRDVIIPGETSRLPGTDAPTLIHVTTGLVRIQPSEGAPMTLRPGESMTVTGAATITATGETHAAYLAALIGAEVARTPPSLPPPPPPAPTEPPRAPTTIGVIEVTPYACPAGMRPETFDAAACAPALDAADLQLFLAGSGGNLRTRADAVIEGDAYVWTGLPFGEYLVQATSLPADYDRYLAPGLDGVSSSPELGYAPGPNEGYLVPLRAAEPVFALDLYVFADVSPATGTTDLVLFAADCPPGVVATQELYIAGCTAIEPVDAGLGIRLSSSAFGGDLTFADAERDGFGGLVWPDLPPGTYTVTVSNLPPRYSGYALRTGDTEINLTLLTDPAGYSFRLSGDSERVYLDLFTLTAEDG